MASKFGSLWRPRRRQEASAVDEALPEPLFKSWSERALAVDHPSDEPLAEASPVELPTPEIEMTEESTVASPGPGGPTPVGQGLELPAPEVSPTLLFAPDEASPAAPSFGTAVPTTLVEQPFEDVRGAIVLDRLLFRGDGVAFAGWAWFGSPPIAMRLLSARPTISDGVVPPHGSHRLIHEFRNFRLPSYDFVPENGEGASRIRFDEFVAGRMSDDIWDIAFAVMILELEDGRQVRVPFTRIERGLAPPSLPLLHAPRLGIGVTTFNRRAQLEQVLDGIIAHTRTPYDLIVCDDGSRDDTIEMLRRRRIPHIAAPNRGIAWNKNRTFYYLAEVRRCDALIILEDDTTPSEPGWEHDWMAGTLAYGHVNYRAPWFGEWPVAGSGQWWDPAQSRAFTGQCIGLSRHALLTAGYMDVRFKVYGFEHLEHTVRLGRHGFGVGRHDPDKPENRLVYLINSRITGLAAETHGTGDNLSDNAPVFHEAMADHSYREAWRTPEQRDIMLAEMVSAAAW